MALVPVCVGITILYSTPNPLRTSTAISIPERFLSSGEIIRPGPVPRTSIGHRYLIWSAGRAMVLSHPFLGVGPGFFGEAYPAIRDHLLGSTNAFEGLDPGMRKEDVIFAHNDYLQAAAELGTPGLALFLALIVLWVLRAWRRTQGGATMQDRLVRLGFLSGVAATLIGALVSYPLHIPVVAVLLWSFLGLASEGEGQ